MTTTTDVAVREGAVITPADRAAAAADAGLDSWLIVMKDVVLLAEHICNTSFVPKAYRGNAPATAAAILTGRELGIPPMTALRHVQVVEGVPSLDAEYKRARVLAAGHELDIVKWDNDECVMSGRRRGSTRPPLVVSYTMKDARMAGLVREGGNYVKRPRVMTLARATTLITNAIFADVTNGLATTELLESGDEDVIADYAGTGPDIPGLQPERHRVTADQARQRHTVTAEVVTPPDTSPAQATPLAEPPNGSPRNQAGAGEARPPAKIATGQLKQLNSYWQKLGGGESPEDWDQWLADLARLAGLDTPVASPAELTQAEADRAIRQLKPLPDAKALRKLLDTGEIAGGGSGE